MSSSAIFKYLLFLKLCYGKIEIPDGKDGARESNNDAIFSNTLIHQRNGYGKVTNFKVSLDFQLNVQIDTNTEFQLIPANMRILEFVLIQLK